MFFKSFISSLLIISLLIFPTTNSYAGNCKTCTGYGGPTTVGDGDTACGGCENIITTWTIGDCVSSTSESANCAPLEYYSNQTDVYACDSSNLSQITAVVLTATCGGAGALTAMGCGAACVIGGVVTLGASCALCILGASALGGACYCLIAEASCPCSFSHTTNSNAETGCWRSPA